MKDDSLIESVFNSVCKANYGVYLRLGNLICSCKDKYGKQPENSVAPDIPLIYGRVTVVAMGRVLILIQVRRAGARRRPHTSHSPKARLKYGKSGAGGAGAAAEPLGGLPAYSSLPVPFLCRILHPDLFRPYSLRFLLLQFAFGN